MTPLIIGVLIILAGVFLTAAEVRACAYERHNLGPIVAAVGLALAVGAVIELAI